MQTTQRYIRIKDATIAYSLSEQTLRRRSREGNFNIYKRCRVALISVAEIEAWIRTGEPQGDAAAAVS